MLAKFRTVPVSEVSPYTETEKRRNRWYKLQEPVGMQVSEGTEMVSGTTAQTATLRRRGLQNRSPRRRQDRGVH